MSSTGIGRAIAVPSRHYSLRTKEKPLAGQRFAIKDCFKLNGIKTTMSSRSYTELYGLETETGGFVTNLISLGAIIVGKTKMTSFASSDEPTDLWVDYHCPINPRGDGYMTPSGSTSGGGAALAGYEWLDQSIGIDCMKSYHLFHVVYFPADIQKLLDQFGPQLLVMDSLLSERVTIQSRWLEFILQVRKYIVILIDICLI